MADKPSKANKTRKLEELLKEGRQAIESAEATTQRVGQTIAAGAAAAAADAAPEAAADPTGQELRCPECYGKAFRPYPISKGPPEYLCIRDDCQTQFRVISAQGRIVRIETLN